MGRTKRERRARKYMHHVKRNKPKHKHYKERITGQASNTVPIIKETWDDKSTAKKNLSSMGLSANPNATIKIPTIKDIVKPIILSTLSNDRINESELEKLEAGHTSVACEKGYVAEDIEKFAKAPRERKFELPKGQVQFLHYLMQKHGEDYVAMSRDPKNHYQETPKQLKAKILRLKNIPTQWNAVADAPIVREPQQPVKSKERKDARFNRQEVEWITLCLNRYGDNYKAMAQDVNNIYQDDHRVIKRMITKFKRSPKHWDKYIANNVPGVYLANKPKPKPESTSV